MNRRLLCAAALLLAIGLPAAAQNASTYNLGSFDRLAILGQARVQLSQGDTDTVTVVGDADVQRGVVMNVTRNGELRVSTDGDWKFWSRDPVLLRVQMKEIHQIVISGLSDVVATQPIRTDSLRVTISGKGDVRIPNLTAEELRFEISGAGDAELGGTVDELVLSVSGAGRVNAGKLRAKEARVQMSGAGTSELWVTEKLRIAVAGAGNVSYWGSPKVRQSISSPIARVTALGDRK